MTRSAAYIVFPDPLVWEAGHEHGLVALAQLGQLPWRAALARTGPYLEAVGYAVHQLGLGERVDYVADVRAVSKRATLFLAPRSAELDHAPLLRALGQKVTVVTSAPGLDFADPHLVRVPPRDPGALAKALAGQLHG